MSPLPFTSPGEGTGLSDGEEKKKRTPPAGPEHQERERCGKIAGATLGPTAQPQSAGLNKDMWSRVDIRHPPPEKNIYLFLYLFGLR